MKSDRGISKFYHPITNPEDWKQLLAEPDKHWKTGYLAKALAYCWQETGDFPPEVRQVFRNSGMDIFQAIEMLVAFPEYKVPRLGKCLLSPQNHICGYAPPTVACVNNIPLCAGTTVNSVGEVRRAHFGDDAVSCLRR